MIQFERWVCALAATTILVLQSGCQTTTTSEEVSMSSAVHYVEIVCGDVDAQCATFEQVNGWSFGAPVAEMGGARVAEAPDGCLIGVRAPLAEHETPIVRTYYRVDDIAEAIKKAEAAGAMVAYPPTQQGDSGTWAIYIMGETQVGLWQD